MKEKFLKICKLFIGDALKNDRIAEILVSNKNKVYRLDYGHQVISTDFKMSVGQYKAIEKYLLDSIREMDKDNEAYEFDFPYYSKNFPLNKDGSLGSYPNDAVILGINSSALRENIMIKWIKFYYDGENSNAITDCIYVDKGPRQIYHFDRYRKLFDEDPNFFPLFIISKNEYRALNPSIEEEFGDFGDLIGGSYEDNFIERLNNPVHGEKAQESVLAIL